FFEDILTEDSLDKFQSLQANYEKNAGLTFELPPKTNADYAWSLGPYTLWKKTRYTPYFDKQPTTSTGRAVLQMGGLGATVAGCAFAALSPFTLPIIATAGSMFMYLHYKYDKSRWTLENKIEYLQELCAANIHYQFETNYGIKWLESLSKLDKERYDYLYENIKKSRNTNVEMNKKVQKVLTDLE
ncbi:uncharacterized protein LOC134262775, partial [Saccostrea cucullata]|uniref:uncharacterized protein LOC134262775 n=1 Tax=Saccostrea cuccullata TaxID=36930 RepID=UPI002ECFDD9C